MLTILRLIAWTLWAILLYSFSLYIPLLVNISNNQSLMAQLPGLETFKQGPKIALIIILITVAILEAVTTFILRHYFLNKPYENGRFKIETTKGAVRFFIVHLINWIIACFVASGGLVFALVTKQINCGYPYIAIFVILMLLNLPRIGRFKAGLS